MAAPLNDAPEWEIMAAPLSDAPEWETMPATLNGALDRETMAGWCTLSVAMWATLGRVLAHLSGSAQGFYLEGQGPCISYHS